VKTEKMFWRFLELWRAIPDDYGRQLSETKSAEKGGCILLLTTEYESDIVKTGRDSDVTKWHFSTFCLKCHVGDGTSDFLFPVGH